ncbi:GH25 family lysozyme [Loigolactobacillus backii]|uniref:GH25 family lysozyme n=1 Tax=Loigolactobacillus backii TaxID=375175 RepID=UPI0022FD5BBA|nr:GH25 family lysozyme [Loigolactobacillus backii]MDA5386943.1 GH25 family lysozyme [Loigolactobacillus backii]MDA5389481.1 GH25 family lysozyme [Loigolactobacillus backii]
MTLKVIDISNYQSVDIAGSTDADAVIVKVSEGTGYVSPKANQQYQLAKSKGKLLGFYHYAAGGDPVAEANYFYSNSKNYFHEAIPALDWEKGSNAAWGNTNWCLQFINRIHELTGVWCLLYTGSDGVNQNAKLASIAALWFAGYPDLRSSWNVPNFIYSTGAWKSLTGWQFTDSNGTLDRSIFYLDAAGWKKIANPSNAAVAKPTLAKPVAKPTAPKSFRDALGDTWYNESGTYTLGQATNLRWGAKTNSSLISTLPAGTSVKYDAFSHHNGYVWIRQPRSGGYGYLVTGESNGSKRLSTWGTFK